MFFPFTVSLTLIRRDINDSHKDIWFYADGNEALDNISCFDVVTVGVNITRFWGLRGRNVLCKYEAFNDSKYMLTAMMCRKYLSGAPCVITGDSQGKKIFFSMWISSIFSISFFFFLFSFHLLSTILLSLLSLSSLPCLLSFISSFLHLLV